jgi:hypothetical protein
MNPVVSQQVIDQAAERDPASAAAEWLAEFRSDIESFINREAVEACIAWDVRERAPMQSVRYHAFVDPSGGSADSMSLAIGHREEDIVVVDALREIEPAQKPKSDLYRDLLPAINSRKLDLLDDARLLTQLVSLERRTARGGRDSIDHPPNTHDDLANAIAGLCGCTRRKYAYDSSLSWVS